jgi:hypothetical protein
MGLGFQNIERIILGEGKEGERERNRGSEW